MLCYEAIKSQGVHKELLLWLIEISAKVSACPVKALSCSKLQKYLASFSDVRSIYPGFKTKILGNCSQQPLHFWSGSASLGTLHPSALEPLAHLLRLSTTFFHGAFYAFAVTQSNTILNIPIL